MTKDAFLAEFMETELEKWGFKCPYNNSIHPLVFKEEVIKQWSNDFYTMFLLLRNKCDTNIKDSSYYKWLFQIQNVRRTSYLPIIARPDCILHEGSLKIIEMNMDSSLGGMMQVSKFCDFYKENYEFSEKINFNSPIIGLKNVINLLLEEDKTQNSILFLVTERFSEYDIDSCNHFLKLLETKMPIKTHIEWLHNFDLDSNDTKLYLKNNFNIIYRFDVIKSNDSIDMDLFKFVQICEEINIPVLTDIKDLKIEDKEALIILTKLSDSNLLLPEQKYLIDKYIAKTVFLSDIINKNLSKELHLFFNDIFKLKNKYVLKKTYSFGGQFVYIGLYESESNWEYLLKKASETPELWVVQEYIPADDLQKYIIESSKEPLINTSNFTISPFFFIDSFYGFLIRTLCEKEHNGVTGLRRGSKMGFLMVAEI